MLIALVALIVLIGLAWIYLDEGNGNNNPIQGEVRGELITSGSIGFHNSYEIKDVGIVIYNYTEHAGHLDVSFTNVTSITIVRYDGSQRDRDTYYPSNSTVFIRSDFNLTGEATFIFRASMLDVAYQYGNFNYSRDEYGEYRLDTWFRSIRCEGRIVHDPSRNYDVLTYDTTLFLNGQSIPVRKAELNFPDDADMEVEAVGIGDISPRPAVSVSGRVVLLNFREYGRAGTEKNVDRLTIVGDDIRIKTLRDYYNLDDPPRPWVIEIRYSQGDVVDRTDLDTSTIILIITIFPLISILFDYPFGSQRLNHRTSV